jgi:2-haloalkanoic acid dehalogenase type II
MPLPPRPQAILFDLDDTLWPIGPVIAAAEQALFAWLKMHAPRVAERHSVDTLRAARLALLAREPRYHLDLGALRRDGLLAAFAEAGQDAALVADAMALFAAARNAVQPYADVLPGLARLRGRYLLGTVSNGNADLAAIGLDHHFGVSLAAHAHGSAKPDPAMFLAACRQLGVAPAAAVYVGDDVLLDVRGAQQAGLRAVWLNRVGRAAHLEHGVTPDAICADFDALIAWLDAWHAPA